jgi:hypothetical protein
VRANLPFEFKEVPFYYWRLDDLQLMGKEGWEVVEIGRNAQKAMLRRPTGPNAEPWEYYPFEYNDLPMPEWEKYLTRHGWTLLTVTTVSYGAFHKYLGKRTGRFVGTDTGDILKRLEQIGYSLSGAGKEKTVRDILRIAGSRGAGSEGSSAQLVRIWAAHKLLPQLFEQHGVSMRKEDPEAVLDEILRLRAAGGGEATLGKAVERWCALGGR